VLIRSSEAAVPAANVPTLTFPPFDAGSNVSPQNNHDGLTGDTLQLSDEDSSLHPILYPEDVHGWSGQISVQSLFDDTNAPIIGQLSPTSPYIDAHSAANQTDWLSPDWSPQNQHINQVPSQPTHGISPALVPSLDSYYQPRNNPDDRFTPAEVATAFGFTSPPQTYSGYNLPHGPALSPGAGRHTATTNSQLYSNVATGPVSLIPSDTSSSPQRTYGTIRHGYSTPQDFRTDVVSQVAFGPISVEILQRGDTVIVRPKKGNPDFVDPPQGSLFPIITPSGAPLKFLDRRPDPLDATKIPHCRFVNGSVVMGVFGGRVYMCYVHPPLDPSLTLTQQLKLADQLEEEVERSLRERQNEIISLIRNSYCWTTLLPRSTAERSNGVATVQKRCGEDSGASSNHYITGDTQKESLIVTAAALSSTGELQWRSVFHENSYRDIQSAQHQLSWQMTSFLRSGVKESSVDELSKLKRVPPEWGDRKLPWMWIDGQLIGEGPEVMNVNSG